MRGGFRFLFFESVFRDTLVYSDTRTHASNRVNCINSFEPADSITNPLLMSIALPLDSESIAAGVLRLQYGFPGEEDSITPLSGDH